MKIPLIGGSSERRSLTADAQRTINMYIESGGSKSPKGLYGKPGIRAILTLGAKAAAMASENGRLFVFAGTSVVELNASLATVQTLTGASAGYFINLPDAIILNGSTPHNLQALIVAGGNCYWWQDGAGVTLTSIDLDPLTGMAYTDGTTVQLAEGIDTTVAAPIAAGSTAVTPASMVGIGVGSYLWIDEDDPAIAELVAVTATTGTTFTATFLNYHPGPSTVRAGDLFDPASMPGHSITINGASYTVDYVLNGYTLVLTTSAGSQARVPWSAVNLPLIASSATFVGGYAVITRPSTRQFNISKLNDFSAWLPLDYALKEGHSDALVRAIGHRGELWLFGNRSIEVWDQTGNPDFPFQRNDSGSIRRGLGGQASLVPLGDSALGFVGDDGCAYVTRGFSLQRVSTPAQENDWRGEFDAITSFSYTMGGHIFWRLNLSTKTWVYDLTENEWTEYGLLNTISGNTFYRDVPELHEYIQEWSGARTLDDEGGTQGIHIVSGNNDHKLYEMSTDFHDDDGTAIRYVRRAGHMCSEKFKLAWHRLVVEVETGQVKAGDPVPNMELRISPDGGKSWRQASGGGDLVVTQSMGANGATMQRLVFRQLGSERDFVGEIACTSKSKMFIADAYGEVSQGNA